MPQANVHSPSAAGSLPQRIIREAPSRVAEFGDQALLRIGTVVGALRNALPAFTGQGHPEVFPPPVAPADDLGANNPAPPLTNVGLLPVLDSEWGLAGHSILPVPAESPATQPRPDSNQQLEPNPPEGRETHADRPAVPGPANTEAAGTEPKAPIYLPVAGSAAPASPEDPAEVRAPAQQGQFGSANQRVPLRSWPESPVGGSASAMTSSSTGLDHAPQRGLSGVLTTLAALPEPALWGSLEAEDVSATSDLSRRPAPTPD
ncbi:hypothetical protein [Actinoalloteichus hymeniacidonis]|nr:hypothetical protein [Actinoalloteichus hymeniacidonis]MBB5906013.1 hypothetical protein [Actinoalloteichus hymeniacidonis]